MPTSWCSQWELNITSGRPLSEMLWLGWLDDWLLLATTGAQQVAPSVPDGSAANPSGSIPNSWGVFSSTSHWNSMREPGLALTVPECWPTAPCLESFLSALVQWILRFRYRPFQESPRPAIRALIPNCFMQRWGDVGLAGGVQVACHAEYIFNINNMYLLVLSCNPGELVAHSCTRPSLALFLIS